MSSGQFHTKESSSSCETIGKEPDAVGQWSIGDQEDEARAAPSAFLEINAALIDTETYPAVLESNLPSLRVREFEGPSHNEHELVDETRSGFGIRLVIVAGALLAALGLGWFGGSNLYRYFDGHDELDWRGRHR